jgi:hypothetical protein
MNPSEPVPAPLQPQRNLAIQRCCDARLRAFEECRSQNLHSYETNRAASDAFRAAMPELSGYENIRDFIACTAYGIVNNSIDPEVGSKFLYAAQIALGALRQEPKPKKRRSDRKNTPPTP